MKNAGLDAAWLGDWRGTDARANLLRLDLYLWFGLLRVAAENMFAQAVVRVYGFVCRV